MPKHEWWPEPHLLKLKPFIEMVGVGDLRSDGPLLSCVRASIVKAYEFSEFSYVRMRGEFAFHCLGALRSICEDLIILKFISGLPPNDQASVISADIRMTLDASLKRQKPFFRLFRPGQPILGGQLGGDHLAKMDAELALIWQSNGWPRKRDGNLPPTQQIAQKIGAGTLEVIYNYIYRLTSGTVHFSARALMRSGWGCEHKVVYSTANMGRYYLQFCQIYSVFLFSIYFEFFGDLLNADVEVRNQVKSLRNALVMYPRWPEMITFEEMNKDLPDYQQLNWLSATVQRVIADEIDDGFIAATENETE
jgi:hypothetical protein